MIREIIWDAECKCDNAVTKGYWQSCKLIALLPYLDKENLTFLDINAKVIHDCMGISYRFYKHVPVKLSFLIFRILFHLSKFRQKMTTYIFFASKGDGLACQWLIFSHLTMILSKNVHLTKVENQPIPNMINLTLLWSVLEIYLYCCSKQFQIHTTIKYKVYLRSMTKFFYFIKRSFYSTVIR